MLVIVKNGLKEIINGAVFDPSFRKSLNFADFLVLFEHGSNMRESVKFSVILYRRTYQQ
jgi:hypothetical protein